MEFRIMKLSKTQRRNLAETFRKVSKHIITVAEFHRMMNHEIERRCNQCGEIFDLRVTLEFRCPKCGSNDIEIV